MLPGIDYVGITVGFACHDGQGNFLLHKRSQHCRDQRGVWDWGGGKMESGETIREAVLREVKEEYGCQGEIQVALPAHDWITTIAGKKAFWVSLGHIVKVNRDEVKNGDPHSIDEISWFKLDNLPQPLHPAVKYKLENFREYFKPFEK